MTTKAKATGRATVTQTAKHRDRSANLSRQTSGETTASPPIAKATVAKRVTAEEINKANALMMKAWDMISQRKNLEVDD